MSFGVHMIRIFRVHDMIRTLWRVGQYNTLESWVELVVWGSCVLHAIKYVSYAYSTRLRIFLLGLFQDNIITDISHSGTIFKRNLTLAL